VRRYFTPGEYISILPFESCVLRASRAHTGKNERSARRSSKLGSYAYRANHDKRSAAKQRVSSGVICSHRASGAVNGEIPETCKYSS
jgi:hypothetical protein